MIISLIKNIKAELKYAFVSFVAGFGLMTLELTATRLVSPYIGNSIYTWTAIIGTILLGSSIGYIWGGVQIDKHPDNRAPAYFALGSAIFVFLINIFLRFLEWIALSNMSVLLISTLSAIFLFFIPSVLIGAISPCLLKLRTKEVQSIGVGSGIISAFWSAGSVFGTILTGFFLVGIIGSQKIILLVSILFVFISFLFSKKKRALLPIILLVGLLPVDFTNRTNSSTFRAESNYYSIEVAQKKLPAFGEARILFLDFGSHSIESVSGQKIHSYPESFPVFFELSPQIKNIYIIGGGAQTTSKKIHAYRADINIDSIEIDPEVNEVAKKYFYAGDSNINYLTGDARLDLMRRGKKYDLIFGDAFNSVISVPGHLLTKEFNELVKSRLTENGLYAVNIASAVSGENSLLFKSVQKTFAQTFPSHIILSFGSSPKQTQNIILIGLKNNLEIDEAAVRKKLERLDDGAWLSSLVLDKSREEGNGEILTDDFFPTEKLLLPNLNSYFAQYASFYYSAINN